MKTLAWTLLASSLLLAGCVSVGPDFHPPAPKAPVLQGLDPARESAAQFQARWWQQFHDPTLDALIQQAVAGNLDLKLALARLREARAEVANARAGETPDVQTGISYARSLEQYPGFSSKRLDIRNYQMGFDASWEIDLFGGIRRNIEGAHAEAAGSLADLQAAQVSLIAEVARNYFALRGSQLRIDVARRTIANQRQTLGLTQAREQIGTGSEQDVASARARLEAVQASLPSLEADASAQQFRLAVLLGRRPGEVGIDLSPRHDQPIDVVLPMGEAGDVLARRPDVRAAEARWHAATARIGVAKADFYPHLSLGGFFGLLSGTDRGLISNASRAWSFAPSISWQGLNVQRVLSRLHQSEAQADQAQISYQQTLLAAIEDVDNAVVGYNQQHERTVHLLAQAGASERAAALARIRYQEGATGFLELLDTERVQLAAEDDLAVAQADINIRAVALYKALGGGWQACGDAACHDLQRPLAAGTATTVER
ncbi:efflux transporter outer membrane subunit [Frateuria aurantia]